MRVLSFREPKPFLQGHTIEFVAEDGRVMFEVTIGTDGRSIKLRGVETCNVGGVLYKEQFSIEPVVSNVVTVRALPYEERAT